MAYLVRSDGVRWGLPRLDRGDALVPGDPCTPAVVSKLLLLPCCRVDSRAEAPPGVALLAAVCLSVAKESGAELRLSGDPAVVKELERRGNMERPCSCNHALTLRTRLHEADASDPQTKVNKCQNAQIQHPHACLCVHDPLSHAKATC